MVSNIIHIHIKFFERDLEKKMARFFVFGIGSFLFLYVYFIGASIFSSLAREDMNSIIRTIGSNVGELESTYVALSKEITLSEAELMGFVDPDTILYAKRGSFATSFWNNEAK
ncbi:MAG: hypothetical protein COZ49_01220 [Candidatus Yonathbacteria bacterium CG_4_10_14_3_um_filter_47_65]|uniref:Cell division protein FtsL n=2 Tax=Parcubacteria group TaxID=1794811 RepID=A0A2M8D9G3_9BACT|nr:MAG: hypothetical protein AUJ44_02915 [Candidatus Nomurabacteria bacterium CG1_02_47_685]PIP03971.1 MAG: hypothetical protein COX54_01600 [Candidatus Yonathbacteria bacterium CG23_combo_of_CG06-09_8_20_14_all_46_18]PIQ33222.1 MAG: hypothetical protein COW61_00175 [Candidatus Yonathbacteria bacterium CG17_big_fil_post_rev_8_21_14_2_50_46_19]PIX56586.1 MAG: hypothetical protein COZ49_01220 [Candidatus Yonathbacteria bacterium CG_4_10_14_3_um_filter_47_65]PIY57417.1 MAG: hypothetical protein CO